MLQSHSLFPLTQAAALHVPLPTLSSLSLQHISQQQTVSHLRQISRSPPKI